MRAALIAVVLLSGCTAPNDQAGDGGTLAGPCDGHSCSFGQICITEVSGLCGGAAPPCEPVPDGGACPDNYAAGYCPGSGMPGCVGQCVTTGHRCMTTPAACNPARCSCLPSSVCTAGSCAGVSDGVVMCISA